MNPGAVEEAGKTAGIFFTIMKDQPLALALAICNLVLLGLFFYVANLASSNRRHEFELILAAQKEVQTMLFNCVPHQRGDLIPLIPLPRPKPEEF